MKIIATDRVGKEHTVDGRDVLLMNGGISWVGPNYVLSWVPRAVSPN